MPKQKSGLTGRYLLALTACFTLFALLGCRGPQPNTPENVAALADATATLTDTPLPATITPSLVPPPTATTPPPPASTATSTATAAPSQTPTPSLTPLATVPPIERGQLYADLMGNNGGCPLPCWWGFELGVATLAEVQQFYTAFDVYFSQHNAGRGRRFLYVTFVDPGIANGTQVRHGFEAQDGIIIEVEVEIPHHEMYQIRPILERLGPPAEIWMWTIPYPVDHFLPASFSLYFPERGVLVSYATGGELADDEMVNICFNDFGGAALALWDPDVWDPEREKDIVARAEQVGGALRLDDERPIAEVSNWDVEQFYLKLIDPDNDDCLRTPASLWPGPF